MTVTRVPRALSDALGADWRKVALINDEIDLLESLRVDVLPYEGSGAPAGVRLAVQVRLFTQAAIYRIVAVATGAISAWVNGNVIASYLCARATIETAAILWDLIDQLTKLIDRRDYGELQSIIFRRMLGGRHLANDDPDFTGVNILTILKRFEATMPGISDHYALLCEYCHPNFAGTYDLFARRDERQNVVFSNGHNHHLEGFSQMMGALTSILAVRLNLIRSDVLCNALQSTSFGANSATGADNKP